MALRARSRLRSLQASPPLGPLGLEQQPNSLTLSPELGAHNAVPKPHGGPRSGHWGPSLSSQAMGHVSDRGGGGCRGCWTWVGKGGACPQSACPPGQWEGSPESQAPPSGLAGGTGAGTQPDQPLLPRCPTSRGGPGRPLPSTSVTSHREGGRRQIRHQSRGQLPGSQAAGCERELFLWASRARRWSAV